MELSSHYAEFLAAQKRKTPQAVSRVHFRHRPNEDERSNERPKEVEDAKDLYGEG